MMPAPDPVWIAEVSGHLLVVLAATALMAGTIAGFLLARSVGILGFKLTFSPRPGQRPR